MDQIKGPHRREAASTSSRSTTTASNRGSNRLPITEAAWRSARSLRREAVHTGDQEALHARRQGCRELGRIKVQFASAANYATLGEETNDFLGEERIALSLLGDLPRERLGQGLDLCRRCMRRRMSASGAVSGVNLETTVRSSQGGEYSGRCVVITSGRSPASLSMILPNNSSKAAAHPVHVLDDQGHRRETATRLE